MSKTDRGTEEPTECPSCDQSFKSVQGMRSHHTQIHGESLVEPDGPECPTCGDVLPSEAGLKRHHKLVHGESLVDKPSGPECPTCGRDDFENARGMKCHHKMAHGESIAGIQTECSWCGDDVRVLPENHRKSDRHFCKDTDCRERWLRSRTGEDSASWEGGMETFTCANCGGDVNRYPSSVNGENVFCGRGCYTDWESTQMRGSDHFNWKGGYEPYYGENWLQQRRKALERDGHTCQSCGHAPGDDDRDLDVHHVRPVRTFDDPEDANALENLVSLCRSCHSTWEGVPVRPELAD